MTNFAPKFGVGERAREPRDAGADANVSGDVTSLPSSQAGADSGAGAEPGGDVSTTSMRRPAAPSASVPSPISTAAVSAAAPEGEPEPRAPGFTSVIRDVSLRGWLGWIHSTRSNATLHVRMPEGASGKIWCSRGDIIDAEWNGHAGEEAWRDMLLLPSGTVTIDFERVHRRRRIFKSTPDLLHIAGADPSLATEAAHAETLLAASHTGRLRSEPFRQSISLATGNLSLPASAASRQPEPQRRRLSRGDYLAGALVLAALGLAGFTFGRLRASSDVARMEATAQSATRQTRSGLRPPDGARADSEAPTAARSDQDLPLIPFVALEVEPAHAQIWLDRELIGMGRVQLGAIRDGVLHELRFAAAGHETKTLFFRDTPPAGRVQLRRIHDNGSLAAKAEANAAATETFGAQTNRADAKQDTSKPAEADHDAPKKVAQRRAPAPTRVAPRTRPVDGEPPPAAERPPPKKPPQIQLIEVHTPRVQVLD